MRSKSLQSLEEDSTNLLLYVWLRLCKQAKQDDAEEECVAVGISQLIDNAIEET